MNLRVDLNDRRKHSESLEEVSVRDNSGLGRSRSHTVALKTNNKYKPSDAWNARSKDDLTSLNHRSNWDAVKFHTFNSSIKVVLVSIFIAVSAQQRATLFNAGYLLICCAFLFYSDELVRHGTRLFFVLIIYNWLVFSLQLVYQSPWIDGTVPCSKPNQFADKSPGNCFNYRSLLGFEKFSNAASVNDVDSLSFSRGLGPSLLIFILSMLQLRVYHSPAYAYVKEFYAREAIKSKARAVECTRLISRKRMAYWLLTQAEKKEAAKRLYALAQLAKTWQSQLWIHEDASSYPPSAPEVAPSLKGVTSTSVTIGWSPDILTKYQNDKIKVSGTMIQWQPNTSLSIFGNWESKCTRLPFNNYITVSSLHLSSFQNIFCGILF